MSKRDDGGSAFPTRGKAMTIGDTSVSDGDYPGMTLRDWFAGQAMAGLCSGFKGGDMDDAWFRQHGCKSAYHIADAMLAERSK